MIVGLCQSGAAQEIRYAPTVLKKGSIRKKQKDNITSETRRRRISRK
jgi:hypothetical protein